MWEGHRIIYPELREKYQKLQKEPFLRPVWDEQALEFLEYTISYVLACKLPVIMTLWTPEGPCQKEVRILKKELRGTVTVLKCRTKDMGTLTVPLSDILGITPFNT